MMPGAAVVAGTRRVSSLGLLRVFWRSLFLQASWNARGMQNVGFSYAIAPALAELYPDPQERARAIARHLEFFNCHPYLAASILGGAVRLEERVATGEVDPRTVSSFKSSLGPPFAALGDGFFWLALRPATALLACATEPFLGFWCIAVFLVLYNSVHLALRTWLFIMGYERGEGVVEAVARAHFSSVTPLLKTCGAILAGAMAGKSVLMAGLPWRPFHALIVGATIVLPRVGITRAVYVALLLGLALGAPFF
jgi:PTS system mannose-specific IID component